jgi:hypothetical protein
MSALDFAALGAAATTSEDLTVDQSFKRELPRTGVALLRLKDYIEFGRQESSNPAYKPAIKVMLTFELNHPDHLIEIDGKKVPQLIQVRMNKGSTSKSGYKKLFKVMNKACGNKFKHFVEMIGTPYLGEIFHNTSGEGEKARTYANLDFEGAYSLKAPLQVDALTGQATAIQVAELDGTPKVFLWENESLSDDMVKSMWDSIYIDGTYEKDGKEISKNWIQNTIMEALDFEGSTTQALTQEHISLDEVAEEGPSIEDLPVL